MFEATSPCPWNMLTASIATNDLNLMGSMVMDFFSLKIANQQNQTGAKERSLDSPSRKCLGLARSDSHCTPPIVMHPMRSLLGGTPPVDWRKMISIMVVTAINETGINHCRFLSTYCLLPLV
ncbi:hypothetical protein [Janthinobacterium sp. PSPC3-1]|uniref:hypothetical protein n=1 Tax=Janthinobacterium sp. PSPC3-1 TaxID=2804653 RepID=UPI003CF60C8C